MTRSKPGFYIFALAVYIIISAISISGCAALQRKFTRKKKKEERLKPVITIVDYSKDLRVEELYKKHFLFWKTAHDELIERMDSTYKKRSNCYTRSIASLMEMKKYLTSPKKEELEGFIIRIESISPDIGKRRLSKSQRYRIKQLLEKTKRQIDKKFSYSQVKEYIEMRK